MNIEHAYCPHCGAEFFSSDELGYIGTNEDGSHYAICPECDNEFAVDALDDEG